MIRNESRTKRRLLLAAIGAALVTVATVPVASGGARSAADTGTLAFRAELRMESRGSACPAGTGSTVNCYAREGRGLVPGLGNVSESYHYPVLPDPPGCPAGTNRVLSYTVRFTVAGKGEIYLAVPGSPQCLAAGGAELTPTYPPITITGGSGAYSGASGSGTLTHRASFTSFGAAGIDTWVGTLVVPGLEFDLTPPTVTGAVGRTIRAPRRAKRVRVTYSVNARDDVDGVVPVSCRPRSGTRFKVGRTVVTCSATDTSANTQTARFTVTVKANR